MSRNVKTLTNFQFSIFNFQFYIFNSLRFQFPKVYLCAVKFELKIADTNLELYKFGSGSKVLIAFHGFDNEAQEFEPLANFLPDYTVISVNLYFHGNSFASEEHVSTGIDEATFKKIHEVIFEKFPAEKYEILGYSMGGRVALKLVELFPEKISRLILLAPDGLKSAALYRFATQNTIGHAFFKSVLKDPRRLLRFGSILNKTKLYPEKKLRFLRYNLENQLRRDKVYNSWMIYRFIIADLKKVKEMILKNQIGVFLILGKWDVLMPPSLADNFSKGIETNINVTILDTGHQLLAEKNLKQIALKLTE